ncbi:MAG: uncharacterized protein A8A55_2814, partial [Amphiamblys sp. WSBS2006]
TKNNSIKLWKIKKLELKSFAVNILPKLSLHGENVMERFHLSAEKTEHISEVIRAENNSIKLGKVKKLELWNRSINILPKLSLHEENEMEVLSLNAKKIEYVSEVMGAENNSIKLGKIKKLELNSFAVNILPKLSLHEKNEMEVFYLNAEKMEYVSEVMGAENNSIKLGKIEKLELKSFAINILPKLSLHKDNVMERFHLSAEKTEHVSEVIRAENNSIKLGKVKKLELCKHSINTLPKLSLHEENVMDVLYLIADKAEHVFEIASSKNNSIKLGKVKTLNLCKYSANVLPKLVLHKENVMEELKLYTEEMEHVSEIIWTENNSIWLGKIKKLEMRKYSANVLPKLVLHEENKLERVLFDADQTKHVLGIINTRGNSIELGKVEKLELRDYAVNILLKLSLHGENVMEVFHLCAKKKEYVSETIKTTNNSIRIGKVKKLELEYFAINILPKLVLHEENVMEEFRLNGRDIENISEIIKAKNNDIWLGNVKKLELGPYAGRIRPKLRYCEGKTFY